MAKRLLNKARDPGKYKYRDIDDYIRRIVNIIREAEFDKNQTDIFGLDMGGKNKRLNRCGLPAGWIIPKTKACFFWRICIGHCKQTIS